MLHVAIEKYAIFVINCFSVCHIDCLNQGVTMCPQKYIQCSIMNMKWIKIFNLFFHFVGPTKNFM